MLQKTKIPARGLKRDGAGISADRADGAHLQKTKIPARGLKSLLHTTMRGMYVYLQKTKIPARGLKSLITKCICAAYKPVFLQKTKIPARGLKRLERVTSVRRQVPSKNQNPREGIETYNTTTLDLHRPLLSSKNQNPREGIETEQ